MIERLKKYKFIIAIILIGLFYFILTSVQAPIFEYGRPDDDYYMIQSAMGLLDFKWLGKFVGRTLSKGPGAPIFFAIANTFGLTLMQAQFLLYFGAVVLFVHVLKKIINNDKLRLAVFIVVLFNPIMYNVELLTVYRDNVYSSFLLYVVSCGLGIFFNYKENLKKIIPYMIGLGVFGTWMAITREETLWIAPFTVGSAVITSLFIIFDKECQNKLKKILLYLIPVGIYLITIFIICLFNKIYYGEFIRIEENSKAFKEFKKAVSSVDVENPILSVPLQKEAREKLYEVSPSFAELKDTFEVEVGPKFTTYGRIPDEIEDGWFMWTIFYGVDKLGYSKNLKTFNDYLKRITNEVNKAFEEGRLKKEDNPESIFDKDNLELFIDEFKYAIEFQSELRLSSVQGYVTPPFEAYENGKEKEDDFEEVTGNAPTNSKTYNYKIDQIKLCILFIIGEIYKDLSKPLFIIGIVIYILIILKFLFLKPRFENYKEFIVLTSLLLLYVLRIFIITYTQVAKFFAITIRYLASTYSIQFAFEILSLIFAIIEIRKFIENKK